MFTNPVEENRGITSVAVVLAASAMMLFSPESKADSGFYLGGSVGQAGVEIEDTSGIQPVTFDEDDFAWKVFGGYNFDLAVINLAMLPTQNLNIRANILPDAPGVGSVVFEVLLNGAPDSARTESTWPYASHGDSPPGE